MWPFRHLLTCKSLFLIEWQDSVIIKYVAHFYVIFSTWKRTNCVKTAFRVNNINLIFIVSRKKSLLFNMATLQNVSSVITVKEASYCVVHCLRPVKLCQKIVIKVKLCFVTTHQTFSEINKKSKNVMCSRQSKPSRKYSTIF